MDTKARAFSPFLFSDDKTTPEEEQLFSLSFAAISITLHCQPAPSKAAVRARLREIAPQMRWGKGTESHVPQSGILFSTVRYHFPLKKYERALSDAQVKRLVARIDAVAKELQGELTTFGGLRNGSCETTVISERA